MVRIGEYTQQRAKVGLFGIGLEAYWDQFDGLKERLGGYRTLKIGNTNSRIRFSWPPAAFVNAWCEQGPTHHCVLSVGHHADTPRKVARLLGLEFSSKSELGEGLQGSYASAMMRIRTRRNGRSH